MQQLLSTYSISEILTFLVIFALAAKGVVTFFDWAVARLKQVFGKEYHERSEQEKLETRLQIGSATMTELKENDKKLGALIDNLTKKIDVLVESDKDDIKAFLTKEHHFYCYQKHWIDDYSLECCERRYAHYKDEGGNSFIGGFMEDLRALPHQPPEDK